MRQALYPLNHLPVSENCQDSDQGSFLCPRPLSPVWTVLGTELVPRVNLQKSEPLSWSLSFSVSTLVYYLAANSKDLKLSPPPAFFLRLFLTAAAQASLRFVGFAVSLLALGLGCATTPGLKAF